MAVKTLKQIYLWPTALNAFSLFGLIFALLQDGIVEKMALIFLSVPIALTTYFCYFKP